VEKKEDILLLALVFLGAGIFVLKAKRSDARPYGRRLYRVDEVAVSTVLFLLGACLLILSCTGLP
jgi:predicted membrane-bound mannosyltransferase